MSLLFVNSYETIQLVHITISHYHAPILPRSNGWKAATKATTVHPCKRLWHGWRTHKNLLSEWWEPRYHQQDGGAAAWIGTYKFSSQLLASEWHRCSDASASSGDATASLVHRQVSSFVVLTASEQFNANHMFIPIAHTAGVLRRLHHRVLALITPILSVSSGENFGNILHRRLVLIHRMSNHVEIANSHRSRLKL